MMACIAALALLQDGKIVIEDRDSIKTSFPSFLKTIKSLGAKIH